MAKPAEKPPLSNPELEARILADPDDLSAYLVYSDWLSERGDPRGELIAVQAKLRETPTDAALLAQEGKLLVDNRRAWLGDLHDKEAPKDLAFTWRLGFIDSVRLGPPLKDYETSDIDFTEIIAALMISVPHVGLVREIIVGSKSHNDWPAEWDGEIEALAEHGVPTGLTRLVFDSGGYWDISSTSLGPLSKLYGRLGRLRQLRIHMGAMDLGKAMDLPMLRSLEIETGGLTADNVKSICESPWPSLERLSLCIGESDNDYGCDVHFEHLLPIFEGASFPQVRHLGLSNTSLADQIAAELPSSKILRQLETLDLSRGTFSDEGARALIDKASAFAHLREIDLTHHYVTEDLQKALAKIGPRIVLADPQEGDAYDDDVYRYCQIGE